VLARAGVLLRHDIHTFVDILYACMYACMSVYVCVRARV